MAAAAPRPPYRYLELCGIALTQTAPAGIAGANFMGISAQQGNGNVVDIGAGRAGDNQPIDRL